MCPTSEDSEPKIPKPIVDDQFWFNWSGTLVNDSIGNIENSANKLQNFMLWLWGAYTAYSAAYLGFKEINYSIPIAIFTVLASISIIIVYFFTVKMQMPVYDTFDPRSPDEIKEVYKSKLQVKKDNLKTTIKISFVSLSLVVLSLLLMSLNGKKDEPKIDDLKYELIATLESKTSNTYISIMAKIENKKNKVDITIYNTKNTSIGNLTIFPSKLGLIQVNIPITKKDKNYNVVLEWEDSKSTHVRLSKIVK